MVSATLSNSATRGQQKSFWEARLIQGMILLGVIILSGCSPWVKNTPILHDDSFLLQQDKALGQTFQSRYDGLGAVSLFLIPEQGGDGVINLEIKSSPWDSQVLAGASLPIEAISGPGFYQLNFQPIKATQNRYLYAHISMTGPGRIKVGGSSPGSYLNGALYRNQEPLGAQLSFQLTYQPMQAFLGLLKQFTQWTGFILAGILLLVMPGWGLMTWISPDWSSHHWGVKLGLSSGVSAALLPIFFLWTNIIGLNLGVLYAWVIPIGAILGIIWKNRRQIRTFRANSIRIHRPQGYDIALIFIILLVTSVRFWPVRSLGVPMWGDSYHHSLITQLFIENQGLFQSWEPYASLNSFTYHFGFHTFTAAFHWLTGASAHESVLWLGQIMNSLALISLIPLAVRIGKSPWAGLGAVLISGLLSPMPMFFVNWGRYTQLTSHIVLPVLAAIAWQCLDQRKVNWKSLIPLGLLMSGLALAHYRVFIFGLIFFVAFYLLQLKRLPSMMNTTTRILITGFGSFLIILPWLFRVYNARVGEIFTQQVTTPPAQSAEYINQFNAVGELSSYLPTWMWLLLPVAVGWGIWRRNRGVVLVTLWWVLIFLAANPQWFNLPGAGVLTSFAVMLGAYIPASIILGSVLGRGLERLGNDDYTKFARFFTQQTPPTPNTSHSIPKQNQSGRAPTTKHRIFSFMGIIILLAVSLIGVRQRLGDVQPETHAMVTLPDLKAFQWIQDTLPADSRFLVNTISAFGGYTTVGSDAGWWLPLLAHRHTNLPPILYVFESSPIPQYRQTVSSINLAVTTQGVNHPDIISLLKEQKITHVYIGQQQGSVGYGVIPSIEPEMFENSQWYTLIYHQDRVWIFELAG